MGGFLARTLLVLSLAALPVAAYAGDEGGPKSDKLGCPGRWAGCSEGAQAKVVVPTDRPLSLEECISLALGSHPRIKGAEMDLRAGEFRTREAMSALWPRVEFNVSRSYSHSARPVRVGGPARVVTSDVIANDLAFNTSWTLFDFGRTYYTVKGSAFLEESLKKDLTGAEQGVAYDVMTAYYNLLKSQGLVKVAQETKDDAESHLKQAQAFYEVGVKPKFDVTQAEVEVNNAQLQVITSLDSVKAARFTLNTRIGADPMTPITVQEQPKLEELSAPLDDYYKESLANRPEIRSIEEKLRASEMSVRAAYADFLPSLSASSAQDWYKEDHTDFTNSQSLQLALNVPIFEGFRTAAKVGEARASNLSTRYRLEDLKKSVLLDVSTSYLDTIDAKARIDTLESSVKKARENLEIAKGRYDAGVGAIIEVTDAQVNLTKAETDSVQAIYDYHLAYTRLLRSVGKDVK